ncbi:MAG: hypothetical protein CL928_18060 [Deltaproteobacteria bacterium]|nr:hypothetical protein [Deltaproteobacteria bacterium]
MFEGIDARSRDPPLPDVAVDIIGQTGRGHQQRQPHDQRPEHDDHDRALTTIKDLLRPHHVGQEHEQGRHVEQQEVGHVLSQGIEGQAADGES